LATNENSPTQLFFGDLESYILLSISGFVLNLMLQRNVSKFAIYIKIKTNFEAIFLDNSFDRR